MRPVDKGATPLANGTTTFKPYGNARPHLIKKLGNYCCYCERRLPLDVEHVHPKSKHPSLTYEWSNLLLSCGNCNSTKLKKSIGIALMPDKHNTFFALEYTQTSVKPNASCCARAQKRAQQLLDLVGLQKLDSNKKTGSDRRWIERLQAWDIAVNSLGDLSTNNTSEMRRQIVRTAFETGFFSIWMTVFATDSDMLLRFIEAFPGTAKDCFDPTAGHTTTKVAR